MKSLIPYSKQSINAADIRAVTNALRSPIITRGKYVAKFEKALAKRCGHRQAVAISSATAGLHTVFSVLKHTISNPACVYMSPNTFIATANAAYIAGFPIKFIAIEKDTGNIDTKALEKELKKAPKNETPIVVAVDFAGLPCNYEHLRKLKSKYGAIIIADAAHSLGATYKDQPSQAWADIAVLSFHPLKSITTGEGGAILCSNNELVTHFRRFKDNGLDRKTSYWSTSEYPGLNYHMTEMQAALGLSQLKRLDKFLKARKAGAKLYCSVFAGTGLVRPYSKDSSYHLFQVKFNGHSAGILKGAFAMRGISTQHHYLPVYEINPKLGQCCMTVQQKNDCWTQYQNWVSIPLYPEMRLKDYKRVIDTIKELLNR